MGVMAVWFLKLTEPWQPVQPWHFFQVLEPDFTPRPVYHALRAYAAERGLMAGDGRPTTYGGRRQRAG